MKENIGVFSGWKILWCCLLLRPPAASGITFPQCTSPTFAFALTEGTTGETMRCEGAGQSQDLIWMNHGGPFIQCPAPGNCVNSINTTFNAVRDATTSTLTVISTVTRPFGTINLTCFWQNQSATCPVDVIYRSDVTCEARYNTDSPQWTVSGSCTITQALSTRDHYACLWFYERNGNGAHQISGQTSQSPHTKVPWSNTSNPYYSFTCSFNMSFPTQEGDYSYSATVYPGAVQKPATFIGSSTVADPANPSNDCPKRHIKERTTLICMCNTSNIGSPPGNLVWNGMTGPQLQVTNVTSSQNNKQYVCEVRRGDISVRNTTYTLQVAYGPRNVSVTGPRLPFDTDGNKDMTLECEAVTYNPSVTYVWYRGNTAVGTNSSYTFRATYQDDKVNVACTATNSAYQDIQTHSALYTLDIDYTPIQPPTIAKHNDILYAGDSLILWCTASGGKPLVTKVIFSCDGKDDQSDVMEQDGVSSNVTFTSLVESNHGVNCTCSALWKGGELYTQTAATRLTVYSKPSDPVINVTHGANYPFIAGETTNATLICASANPGYPPAKYSWPQTAGGQVWTDPQGRGRLTFRTLEPSHNSQQVTCNVSNNFTVDKQETVPVGVLRLEVYYRPIVSVASGGTNNRCELTSNRTWCEVTEGQPVEINCMSSSNPPKETLKWTKDGVTVANISILSIHNPMRSQHTGKYRCVVITGALTGHPGKDPLNSTHDFTVFVTYSTDHTMLNMNGQPHNVTVNESHSVQMSCLANGRPTPTMRLLYSHREEEKNSSVGGSLLVDDIYSWLTYKLDSVECNQAGKYLCTAVNGVFKDHEKDEAFLFVNCKPRGNFSSATPEVNFQGEPEQLSFDVIAYPAPNRFTFSYLGADRNDTGNVTSLREDILSIKCWMSETVYMATCNITVHNMTDADAGNYTVTVGNAYGDTDIRFKLLFNETIISNTPESRTEDPPYGVIAGGVVAAVVAAGVVLLVVFITRRQAGSKKSTTRSHEVGGQGREIMQENEHEFRSKDDDDLVMIDNNLYGRSEKNATASTDTAAQQNGAYEDVELSAVGTAIQSDTPAQGAEFYAAVQKPKNAPTNTTYARVSKTSSMTTSTMKPAVKPKPAKISKQLLQKTKRGNQRTPEKKAVVYGNMTLSMKPMTTEYENFAFKGESSEKTADITEAKSSKSAREDGLVYTTIQFSDSQKKKASDPLPTRETTEYVSLAFGQHGEL